MRLSKNEKGVLAATYYSFTVDSQDGDVAKGIIGLLSKGLITTGFLTLTAEGEEAALQIMEG